MAAMGWGLALSFVRCSCSCFGPTRGYPCAMVSAREISTGWALKKHAVVMNYKSFAGTPPKFKTYRSNP